MILIRFLKHQRLDIINLTGKPAREYPDKIRVEESKIMVYRVNEPGKGFLSIGYTLGYGTKKSFITMIKDF
jgi:hypothetical protein